MSAIVSQLDIEVARHRAERIRFHATAANDSLVSLQKLVHQARELEDHATLGYPSWTAYVLDLFGDEPLRLARDVRRELVAELADAGMSTRAIAPIVGVSRQMVSKDLAAGGNQVATSPASVEVDGITVNPATGEVINDNAEAIRDALQDAEDAGRVIPITGPGSVSAPAVTEHTFTEKVKTVTGLDGKTYTQKPREPKPVIVGDEANLDNARRASTAMGSSLETLYGLGFTGTRNRIITDWWPLGKDRVPPAQTELFTPSKLRQIAQGLIETANELEALNV